MSYTVIYAGTFDPITNGHLDIIERAAKLFGKVIVAVARNPSKQPLFSLEERTLLVKQSCVHLSNVQAVGFSGLLADFAAQHQAKALIRGIRGNDDIEYEIQLAQLNEKLEEGLETIFLPPAVQWRYLSSTMVREIYHHQGDVAQFVPPFVLNALKEKE
ncbi:pantetheine-phosphate adenylyltransferase [Actinobacillus equuli]|uniref:pantetheine-phosphate adenylyltransferase n=1 Tax=Actinobacillus equuli TaxID=718 RepID=UPI002440F3E2|nr:pantetheine-phosphate adenylyltransferase [Actinobacillus equuli]WGE45646.1 pantetheine-phosphate adenylyltransferase [Actinobacillus equuli subsp. haemolyticus]